MGSGSPSGGRPHGRLGRGFIDSFAPSFGTGGSRFEAILGTFHYQHCTPQPPPCKEEKTRILSGSVVKSGLVMVVFVFVVAAISCPPGPTPCHSRRESPPHCLPQPVVTSRRGVASVLGIHQDIHQGGPARISFRVVYPASSKS